MDNISPIDGRYYESTKELSTYFSEFSFFKYRLYVELRYFIALIDVLPELEEIRNDSVKYTILSIWTQFKKDDYLIIKEYEETLFVNEQLKKAVDDIYKYPLKEFARETLNRQLKAGISDDQLASLVISLREEDKLAIVNEDEQPSKEPQIICSLGLKNS